MIWGKSFRFNWNCCNCLTILITPPCNRPSGIHIFAEFWEKTSPSWLPLGYCLGSVADPDIQIRGGGGGGGCGHPDPELRPPLYPPLRLYGVAVLTSLPVWNLGNPLHIALTIRTTKFTLFILRNRLLYIFYLFLFKTNMNNEIHWFYKRHKSDRVETNDSPGIGKSGTAQQVFEWGG